MDCDPLSPGPVQVNTNVALAFSALVDCEPCRAWLPDQPQDAVQPVALAVVHVSVPLASLVTVLGVAC